VIRRTISGVPTMPSTALMASTAPGVHLGRPAACTRDTGRPKAKTSNNGGPTAKASDSDVRPRLAPTKPRNGGSRSTTDQPTGRSFVYPAKPGKRPAKGLVVQVALLLDYRPSVV
jgi:hypothetical protein